MTGPAHIAGALVRFAPPLFQVVDVVVTMLLTLSVMAFFGIFVGWFWLNYRSSLG